MAVLALTDAYIELNSVDMSAYANTVELSVDGTELDVTNFASDGWKEVIGGLKAGNIRIGWLDNFAATTVDDRLWALFNTVTTWEIRPTNASVGTTNPSYSGSLLLNSLQPVAGNVGDLAVQSLTWPLSGAVTRATS